MYHRLPNQNFGTTRHDTKTDTTRNPRSHVVLVSEEEEYVCVCRNNQYNTILSNWFWCCATQHDRLFCDSSVCWNVDRWMRSNWNRRRCQTNLLYGMCTYHTRSNVPPPTVPPPAVTVVEFSSLVSFISPLSLSGTHHRYHSFSSFGFGGTILQSLWISPPFGY